MTQAHETAAYVRKMYARTVSIYIIPEPRCFELQPQDSQTQLIMDHSAFPEGLRAHLNGEQTDGGWHRQYWEPLKKYLA